MRGQTLKLLDMVFKYRKCVFSLEVVDLLER
jgi:hypothetical protein